MYLQPMIDAISFARSLDVEPPTTIMPVRNPCPILYLIGKLVGKDVSIQTD